jgi:hypothetical protein
MSVPVPLLTLSLLPHRYAIVRLAPDFTVPVWASVGEFFSITRTQDEISIVCAEKNIPVNERPPQLWHAMKVHGPFKFDEIGILAGLAVPLAVARIGIFVVSTFDTDYLLVQAKDVRNAIATLQSAGHRFTNTDINLENSKESDA